MGTLKGSPPAYVGYEDIERLLGTRLGKAHTGAVLLLNEAEKATPKFLQGLLEDPGRVVDGRREPDSEHERPNRCRYNEHRRQQLRPYADRLLPRPRQ